MSRQAKPIRSDIAWSTTGRITVRGRDLPGQILGHMNLGEFAFFQLDMAGPYVRLIQAIAAEAERVHGRSLPVNATGAICAICCEFGFPWWIVRGFGVMARAIGLIGHILEEHERPIAREVWLRVDDEATAHLRPA